jgi:hypothetical protein
LLLFMRFAQALFWVMMGWHCGSAMHLQTEPGLSHMGRRTI